MTHLDRKADASMMTGPVLMGSHHADLTPRTGVRFWTRTAGPVPTWCAA